MEQVVIHLTGSAEEVREALLVLAGVPEPQQLPTSIDVSSPIESKAESKESKAVQSTESIVSPVADRLISHKGPYSDTLCARDGCHNKLTVKQVKQGSKYCGLRCAGMARRGLFRGRAAPEEVTIVAGEGVTKGSVMSAESAPKLPVPS